MKFISQSFSLSIWPQLYSQWYFFIIINIFINPIYMKIFYTISILYKKFLRKYIPWYWHVFSLENMALFRVACNIFLFTYIPKNETSLLLFELLLCMLISENYISNEKFYFTAELKILFFYIFYSGIASIFSKTQIIHILLFTIILYHRNVLNNFGCQI